MKNLWISASKMTGLVQVNDKGRVAGSAAIFTTFRGQPVENLLSWLSTKFGEVQVVDLDTQDTDPRR